jgi:hypothetical protein
LSHHSLTSNLLTKVDDETDDETASHGRAYEQISEGLCGVFLFPLDSVLNLKNFKKKTTFRLDGDEPTACLHSHEMHTYTLQFSFDFLRFTDTKKGCSSIFISAFLNQPSGRLGAEKDKSTAQGRCHTLKQDRYTPLPQAKVRIYT